MQGSTITSKGQITIPKSIRDALGVGPGDRVLFVRHDDGTVVVEPATVDVRDLFGRLKRFARGPVSVEEMNEAIADAAVERYRKASST